MIYFWHERKRCAPVGSQNFGSNARTRGAASAGKGQSPEVVARVLGLDRSTVYGWLARYRRGGFGALKAKPLSGCPPKLDGSCAEVDLRYRDAKRSTADEIRFRAMDALDGCDIDQGQIQDRLEPCLGGAAFGSARHYLPEPLHRALERDEALVQQ